MINTGKKISSLYFGKSANMTHFLFWKTGYININAEFYADFKFVNVGFKKMLGEPFKKVYNGI
jgi:hypothetical protein